MARFSGVLVTRSLATRKRTPRWRGATVGLIHLSVNQVAGRSGRPLFSVAVLRSVWPDTKGTSPSLRFGAKRSEFFDRRFAYFLTKNSDPLPYGLMLLGFGSAHFISPATKKRGGETKRGAGSAIPLTPQIEENNHEHPAHRLRRVDRFLRTLRRSRAHCWLQSVPRKEWR